MEIDIFNYLSKEDIEEICRQEATRFIRDSLSKTSIETIITNIAYHSVYQKISEVLPSNVEDMIVDKIPAIIEGMSFHSIFRPKDAWERQESKGWTILQANLANLEPQIQERIAELITKMTKAELLQVIKVFGEKI